MMSMRRTLVVLAAAAMGTGCSSTEEVSAPLATSLQVDYVDAAQDTTIAVVGQQIIGAATVLATCASAHRVDARLLGGVVRVVVTDSVSQPVPCALVRRYVRYTATAAPAPRGMFDVELVLREVVGNQATTTTLERQAFALP